MHKKPKNNIDSLAQVGLYSAHTEEDTPPHSEKAGLTYQGAAARLEGGSPVARLNEFCKEM